MHEEILVIAALGIVGSAHSVAKRIHDHGGSGDLAASDVGSRSSLSLSPKSHSSSGRRWGHSSRRGKRNVAFWDPGRAEIDLS